MKLVLLTLALWVFAGASSEVSILWLPGDFEGCPHACQKRNMHPVAPPPLSSSNGNQQEKFWVCAADPEHEGQGSPKGLRGGHNFPDNGEGCFLGLDGKEELLSKYRCLCSKEADSSKLVWEESSGGDCLDSCASPVSSSQVAANPSEADQDEDEPFDVCSISVGFHGYVPGYTVSGVDDNNCVASFSGQEEKNNLKLCLCLISDVDEQ